MLDICGATWTDVGRTKGFAAVLPYVKGEAAGYPVLFPPILKHGDVVMNQTPAILMYLAALYGLEPANVVERAHAMEVSLLALDCLSNAEKAYHPKEAHGSYASQHKEAEPTIAAFMESRLPRFLAVFERAFAANPTGSGWAVGGALSFADVVLYNFARGYRSSQPAHWAANAAIPLLKAHAAKMDALPRVAAFLASDRCTKMEAPTSSPLAEKPNVQVNSFM